MLLSVTSNLASLRYGMMPVADNSEPLMLAGLRLQALGMDDTSGGVYSTFFPCACKIYCTRGGEVPVDLIVGHASAPSSEEIRYSPRV